MPEDRPYESDEHDAGGRLGDFSVTRRIFQALQDDDLPSTGQPGLPVIKDYVVLRMVGGGGGGEVFQAVRRGSEHPVAIKLLRVTLNQGASEQRVWRELDVLSQLHLACVPRVLDHGVHDGRLYFVTDYIEGLGMVEHCKGLSLRQKVEVLARLAEVVQGLHERGVLHRDIKPSNVLVDGHGQPILIDLGIAKLLTEDAAATITETGRPIGTPAYMAPEQARGDRAAISTRSDVYGLGALCMAVLCGQPPHSTDLGLHELIRRVGQEPARNPRAIDPSLPAPLAAIVGKATAFAPEQRYGLATELAQDLRRWLRNEPVLAANPSWLSRVNLYRKRRKAGFALASIAVVLGLAALVAAGWGVSQMRLRTRAEELAGQQKQLADEKQDLIKKFQGIANKFLVEADKAKESGELDRAARLIRGLSEIVPGSRLSDEELVKRFELTRQQIATALLKHLYPNADLAPIELSLLSLPEVPEAPPPKKE